MLAKDLKSYQDTISAYNLPTLQERFEFIRQLGNVFLVRPEILKSYITENYLGRIDSHLLRPYLAQRSDWGQFGFDGDGEQESKGGLKDRFGVGRLGAMMKELEGMRIGFEDLNQRSGSFATGFSMPSIPFSIATGTSNNS